MPPICKLRNCFCEVKYNHRRGEYYNYCCKNHAQRAAQMATCEFPGCGVEKQPGSLFCCYDHASMYHTSDDAREKRAETPFTQRLGLTYSQRSQSNRNSSSRRSHRNPDKRTSSRQPVFVVVNPNSGMPFPGISYHHHLG